MGKYERILTAIKEETSLFTLIQQGFKPEDIKQAIIGSLDLYFENKDILEELAIEVLVPESINLLKLQRERMFFEAFGKCLSTYRLAKSIDAQSCFEACAKWQPQIIDSISKYWSMVHLELDKSSLEIEEFSHECLRTIGEIIEGITKPYLKVLLNQSRITRRIGTTPEEIDSLDLGMIVSELIASSTYPRLFAPPPWSVRLNQWRNIAYHHTTRIEKDEIVCWYGQAPTIKEIRLSKDQLLQVTHAIHNVYRTVGLVYTLFFVDNIKEIRKLPLTLEVRNEAEFLNFASGIASQGFEIVKCEKTLNEARLIVRDVSNLDPDKWRFHASQFLLHLWSITHSHKVVVEYRERDNTRNLLVSVNSDTCEKIDKGELEPLTLANMIEMVDLKTGKVVPPVKGDK